MNGSSMNVNRGSDGPERGPGARAVRPADGVPVAGIVLLLLAAVVGVLGWSTRHGFLNYDDDLYVTDNALVCKGLTLEGVEKAFGTVHSLTWHPLTTISHMLDVQLFGLDPAGHHATNVLLHAATAIGLFLLLRRLTGAGWTSALAAFLFALHPLRVESVAWVSERKDVLSGFFFVLTLGAYARYARAEGRAVARYALVLSSFVLGLMAKPMLATVPFVLLLLDHWPLGRLGVEGAPFRHLRRCVLEKVPLFALSAAACAVTLATQQGAMTSSETLGFPARLANAVVSYGIYLRQFFVPIGLGVVYPHPRDGLPAWQIGLALLVLAIVTGLTLRHARRRPALLVGWLWYLGMLVPVIGLVQVGIQAHADRYTYLPHIGLVVMLLFGFPEVLARASRRTTALGLGAIAALSLLSFRQVGFWSTSVDLWEHTLAVTEANSVAHAQLGAALQERGQVDEAVEQFHAALDIQPDYATPHYNLGNVLVNQGDLEGAAEQFRLAVQARPDYAKAYNNLGSVQSRRGALLKAIDAYREAVRIDPEYAAAHGNLAIALGKSGQMGPAIEHLERAARLDPDSSMRHYDLGLALEHTGERARAREQFEQALAIAEKVGDSVLSGILRARIAAGEGQ